MNTAIQTYSNSLIQTTVRTVILDGEPWFVGKDICSALGYKDCTNALKQHCRGVVKHHPLQTAGGMQEIRIINEPDMMRLICNSTLPAAAAFERWVFEEILPAIRRTGGYIQTAPEDTPEAIMARALLIATDTLARQKQHIASLEHKAALEAPKTRFAELVADSESSILIGEFAKILRQNGADIGQNRLFTMLRNDGYLGRRGENKNLPTQKAMELGLFRIQKHVYTNSRGESIVKRTAKLTGKGQIYFAGKYATHHAPQTA